MSKRKPSVLKGKYLTEKISKDELVERLKIVSDVLRDYEQDEATNKLDAIASALGTAALMRHRDKEVKILTACCLSDIMRIYAPDAPYADSQLVTVFTFFTSQLRGLETPSGPYFSRYFYLLERLALVKAFIVITGFDTDELMVDLFTMLFDIVGVEHSNKVVSLMIDVMQSVVDEAETITQPLLDKILSRLLPDAKQENESAYKMTKKLIDKCATRLEPYITTFFNIVIAGKSSESELGSDVYTLIYELNQISPGTPQITYIDPPGLLLNVLPNLAQDLQVEDKAKRLDAVKLLGRLFAARGSQLGTAYTELFTEFMSRFADKDQDVRLTMVAFAKHLLINHTELRGRVTETLLPVVQDADERMRKAVVTCVIDAATASPDCISQPLLEAIGHRTRDKKIGIRRDAVERLAALYHASRAHDPVKFSGIPNVLMHTYHSLDGQIEARLRLDRLLDQQILPKTNDTDVRGRALYNAYVGLDESGRKAFKYLALEKRYFQRTVSDWIAIRKNPAHTKTVSSKISMIVSKIGETGGRAPSGADSMARLSEVKDNRVFHFLNQMCKPDSTLATVRKAMEEIVARLSSKNPIIEFIKNILVKLNTAAMSAEMMPVIFEEIQSALESDNQRVVDGLELVEALSAGYPEHLGSVYPQLSELLEQKDLITPVLRIIKNTDKARDEPLRDYLVGTRGLLGKLKTQLTALCVEGTAQQAKLAVDCIVNVFGKCDDKVKGKVKETDLTSTLILDELLKSITSSMRDNHNTESLCTAIKTLGQIALRDNEVFITAVGDVVPFLVKDVLASADDDVEYMEDEAGEVIAGSERGVKVAAIQSLVKYLIPLVDDLRETAAPPVLRLLLRLINDNGKLIPSHTPSPTTAATLKLAAAKGLLKLCMNNVYERMLQPQQFMILALCAHDDSKVVRAGFLAKLTKYARDLHLSQRLGAVLALYANDHESEHVSRAKSALGVFFRTRREWLDRTTDAGPTAQVYLMPEYCLPYLVYTLSHCPSFSADLSSGLPETTKIVSMFFTELLKLGNNVVFTSHLIDTMKTTRDAVDKESNIVCDVCSAIIKHKTHDKKYQDAGTFPGEVRLPGTLFSYAPDTTHLATTSFLPQNWKYHEVRGGVARESMSPSKSPNRKKRASDPKKDDVFEEGLCESESKPKARKRAKK